MWGSEAATEDGCDAQLVQMGPKCTPTPLQQQTALNQPTVDTKQDGSVLFLLFTPDSDPNI